VVAVAVVEVAVEGLLLGEALGGIGADRGADVAEDRGPGTAGLGGADAISVLPFTLALGLPDRFARRVARNT